MLVELKNGNCSLTVDSKGAEIMSLKRNGREFFWQREKDENGKKIWDNSATNCFPVVGTPVIIDDNGKTIHESAYKLDGKTYYVKRQHGFIRDSEFEVMKQTKSSVKLLVKSSPETKAQYPFDFNYIIEYKLDANGKVDKALTIENLNKKEMPFDMGDHEGFALDDDMENYYLMFEAVEEANAIRAGKPVIKTIDAGLKRSIIPFKKEIFKDDSGVEKAVSIPGTIKSKNATIMKYGAQSESDEKIVSLTLDAPKFILWSRGPSFRFICPEPWHGSTLKTNENEESSGFSNSLKPGEKFVLKRTIQAHDVKSEKEREF